MKRQEPFSDHAKGEEGQTLFGFRIFTFGRFTLERVEQESGQRIPFPQEQLQTGGAAPPLALLKALLSCPDRFATRSWLLEQFWPNSKQSRANARLNDVVSALRGLLRPPGSTEMSVHFVYGAGGQGAGYRLDGYPQIWCDADAFLWYVEHGIVLDRMGQDSTTCWQYASELAARGVYLPEHIYDDWASDRREVLEARLRDCVQRWSTLLREQGHLDEAIVRLRSYWQTHQTDEDILRPLLELLGEREWFQEAETCYRKAQTMLAADGYELHVRTQQMLEYVRARKIQRPPSISHTQERFQVTNTRSSDMRQRASEHEYPSDQIVSPASSFFSEDRFMASFDKTRRFLLEHFWTLAGFGAIRFPFDESTQKSQGEMKYIDALTFSTFQNLLGNCWQLCNGGHILLAGYILESLLATLTERASFQLETALLVSHGLRLKSLLCAHQLQLAHMIPLCQQSVTYAQVTRDPNVLSAALNGLAVAYKYNQQYEHALEAYEAALSVSEQATPLLRTRVYAGASAMFASQGKQQEALHLIDLAYEQFPEHPEDDPMFFIADNGWFMLAYYEGLLHLELEQPKEALRAFEKATNHPRNHTIPARNRLEIVNCQGQAAIHLGDREMYAHCLEEGVTGAQAIRSQKRLAEVLTIFQQQMPQAWREEPEIKQLVEKMPILLSGLPS